MNERFAADPACFNGAAELRGLLDKFGIFTGRYLAQYPDDWETRLLNLMSAAPPVERERIQCVLRRAKERYGLIRVPGLMWMDRHAWIDNAGKLTAPPAAILDGLVIPSGISRPPIKSWSLDDLDLPPTAEERVASTPEEYVRVSGLLLRISHELIFVDPYLNPCNRFVAPVLKAMLGMAVSKNSKCHSVNFYARTENILSGAFSLEDIQLSVKQMLEEAVTAKPFKLRLILLDDSRSTTRMHDRYLCSVKGGIQFSQGFQKQRNNAKMTTAPVSRLVHKEIWAAYFEGASDMRVDRTITISSD